MKISSKAVILIVDDKPGNIMALENVLAEKDRLLLSATCGKDALQIALNRNIDLIILDVQMPEMDGFEVAQILKSNKKTRDIPIIFATAESKDHQFVIKGYDEGAIDYLFKPLNPEIVKAKVAVLIRVRLQNKELQEKNYSLQRSALLIDNCADIIGIIDARTFKIEEINTAFTNILGYSLEDSRHESLTFYLSEEDREMVHKLPKNENARLSFETSIYCKDRSIKWLQWNVVVRFGKWFANARDITTLKEVEKIRNYLATVVKQSNDAIYIHDKIGNIISWNQGAEKMYGYSEQEALRMKIWNIIPEYLQNDALDVHNSLLNGEKVFENSTQRVTRHGRLIDVLFSGSLIKESHNGPFSMAVTERDITWKKLAEDKLKENQAFLKSILDTMCDAVVVTDSQGEVKLLNPAAKRIFGEAMDQRDLEKWASAYGFFCTDTISPFPPNQVPIVKALQGIESAQEEMFIRNSFVPDGMFVIASSSPLKNENARVSGGVSVFHDISTRKKVESELKESEARFRNLFEYAPFPMWVYDLETLCFLEVNQPAIDHYGYSRSEFLNMRIVDIRPENEISRILQDIKDRSEKVQTSKDWQHRLRNGKIIDVEITSHLIDFWGHKAALVISKDITDQKLTEEQIKKLNQDLQVNVKQLEETNKEMESFSYSVSHDLRAPLRGLSGYSTMLQEDYSDILDDEGKRLLSNIQRNAHKMGLLIDDLLNFSRLGRKELQKAEVNMEEMVRDVWNEISVSGPMEIEFRLSLLPWAHVDSSLFRQVWINLLSNAIKYSGKKDNPIVEVGSTVIDEKVVYYIKDNGTGFNMKYADKLFGVFQRLHSANEFEGTGIGLAIVHRIISKHGGRIWAEAQENLGATFYFTLPD